MNNLDKKYIIDGITINRKKDGYSVFTILTQHFNILDLDELTNERFEKEIERQNKYEKDSNKLMNEMLKQKSFSNHDVVITGATSFDDTVFLIR